VRNREIKILGIDPGSRFTGFGLVSCLGRSIKWIEHGVIRAGEGDFAGRLETIYRGLSDVIELHRPDLAAIEKVFMARNADSALKLGQARGVAMLAPVMRQVPVTEYTARQIKQSVTGQGGAEKQQIQHMVSVLLGLRKPPATDAADALAVAICHAHAQSTHQEIATSGLALAGARQGYKYRRSGGTRQYDWTARRPVS
jgi:crossover junction endodeoxyribonuclease RuvC